MSDLVCARERSLGNITLVLGCLCWLILLVGTMGGLLIALLIAFLIYLFAQSALIAYIRGNGVELTPSQFPDLHAQFVHCCTRLELKVRPQAFVLNGGGMLNAFATRFLRREYVVLFSEVVDAMDKHPDGVRFYIGHELGHLKQKHVQGQLLRWPVLWLPLLGAAYSRARETTCDRHGRACSQSPDAAARALVALATGPKRWESIQLKSYLDSQLPYASGFWASLHELTGGYPWLTKRVARVLNEDQAIPSRNKLAYVLAAFMPYAGRLGSGFGLLIMIYIVGVLAAVAIPAYQDYTNKALVLAHVQEMQGTLDAVTAHYETHRKIPASLAEVGVQLHLADSSTLELNPRNMVITAFTKQGQLVFVPAPAAGGGIHWTCTNGEGMKAQWLPPQCRPADQM